MSDLQDLMHDYPVPQPRNISNSEVTTFLSCRRQYYYAFTLELEPKEESLPINMGTLGHLYMQYYIEARLQSVSHTDAMDHANKAYAEAMALGKMKQKDIMYTMTIVKRYMDYRNGFPEWDFLGTEDRVELKLTPSINLVIRYDLKIFDKTDGKVKIGDWKFHYEFMPNWCHDLATQLPKYVTVLEANGIRCDAAFMEEIRTRPLGPEKAADPKMTWRRTTYTPSKTKKVSLLKQHIAASLEIEKFRKLSPEEQKEQAIPVLSGKYGACMYCNFKDLCDNLNEGGEGQEILIREFYRDSSYGYNKNEEQQEWSIF